MNRVRTIIASVVVLVGGGLIIPNLNNSTTEDANAGVTSSQTYTVESGDTYRIIANKLGLSETALACANRTSSAPCPSVTANPGLGRIIQLSPVISTSTTTTTTTPSTTTATTLPPTTTAPTSTTTTMSMPTTTAPGPTTTQPSGGGFFEDFSTNSTETLNVGLYRRDDTLVSQTQWQGDHDLMCGSPSTTRTVTRASSTPLTPGSRMFNPAANIWRCAAVGMDPHLMFSEGDTSGYTILFASPKKVFQNVKSVCLNLNLNFGNLGYRQWPSIAVMPVGHTELTANVPAGDAGGLVSIYPPANGFAVADIGSPNGATGKLQINGTRQDFPQFDAGLDAATRYPMCFTDNKNGTLTFQVTGPDKDHPGTVITSSFTRPGSFPTGNVKVVIAFHGYTPTKAGSETGIPVTKNTWHMDNLRVTV